MLRGGQLVLNYMENLNKVKLKLRFLVEDVIMLKDLWLVFWNQKRATF